MDGTSKKGCAEKRKRKKAENQKEEEEEEENKKGNWNLLDANGDVPSGVSLAAGPLQVKDDDLLKISG